MVPEPAGTPRLSFGIGRLFDLVSDAVIVASARSGRVVMWNRAATALFGIARDEAIDSSLVRIIPPPLRERHLDGLARYADGGASTIIDSGESVELPALRGDGTSLWIELKLSSVPYEVEDGDADDRYVIAIIRDITRRKAAEADAIARSDQLQAVNNAMRDFLAAAAHDIVGPAGGVRNAAELIGVAETLEEAKDIGELIRRQSELIIELGRDLGQMAAIEHGSVPTRPESVNIADVVARAIAASVIRGHDEEVVVRVAPELQWFVDPMHATRIVTNLIGNARKYGAAPILVQAMPGAGGVELTVSDHGPGVPVDFADKLFEKFSRARRSGDGLGLGLAICRGLAEANGGMVRYEPPPGAGATFVVRLPDRAPDAS